MQKEKAHIYIPQKPPFVMVDDLLFCDDKICKTNFVIEEDNIFVREGKFIEAGIVENIAQTCATRIGYINTHFQKEKVKIGMIASIKNLSINKLLNVGDVLDTTVEETMSGYFNMTILNAKVECKGELIAECEMKVALTDIETN
ncbi:MAG: pseudouridylate synthase [Bacteroidales bacterium]|jgi:predicted hotdog family 3-hydroxylacyl-ACP dehydratase|nr:pseudouridylate synthase [Bacteroidales bacterium]MDD4702743.1 pseudouridylate synthase [Bacteroidales bacterium]MDX9798210.1 pseudouridylate synthase [Bacteroidales bacterium]